MTTLNAFDDVHPEHALRDPRIISRALYADSSARNGKHYLILKDGQHFIFASVYQHINPTINPSGEQWSGGSHIEIPAPALIWLLNGIAMHRQQANQPPDETPPPSTEHNAPAITIRGEHLSLARTANNIGYALQNHSRPVHLPWANANWHQKLELTDQVLFAQGYWTVLEKLAATLRPAPTASAIMAAV